MLSLWCYDSTLDNFSFLSKGNKERNKSLISPGKIKSEKIGTDYTCFAGRTRSRILSLKLTWTRILNKFMNVFNGITSPHVSYRFKPQVGGIKIVAFYRRFIFQVKCEWLIATLISQSSTKYPFLKGVQKSTLLQS